MPVNLQCSRCMHEQKVDDDKLEKGVPCKICHNLIKGPSKAKPSTRLTSPGSADESAAIKAGAPSPKSEKQTAVAAGKAPTPARPPRVDADDEPKSKERTEERRRPPRKREEGSSSSLMMVLVGAGVLLVVVVLCGGGGIGAYYLLRSSPVREEPLAEADPPPIPAANAIQPGPGVAMPNPGDPFRQPAALNPNNPNDIDRVIALLNGPAQQRGPAYQWLRNANPNVPRRPEVARLLEPLVPEELQMPFTEFFVAYFRWATKDNVPGLKRMAENQAFNPGDNSRRHDAMLTLARLKEVSAADIIASKLGNAFDGDAASRALTEMGPGAEAAVLKYFNAREGRDRARSLIKSYNTSGDAILTQCIADLSANENDRRNNAVQWLANAPVNDKRRSEVAKALNNSIAGPKGFGDRDLFKALQAWGTSDNTEALLNRLKANKTGNDEVIRTLAKIRDAEAVKGIVESMGNVFNQRAAKAALKEIGAPAEPVLVQTMNGATDNNLRRACVGTLGEMGTMQSIPALVQLKANFAADRPLGVDVDRAIKSIQSRGK